MGKTTKVMSCVLSAAIVSCAVSFAVSANTEAPKIRIVVANNTNQSAEWTGVLVDEWVEIKDNSTAQSLFTTLMQEKGFSQTGAESGYITEINGLKAEGMGGWMFGYDDWYGNSGVTAFKSEDGTLQNGDELSFVYSMNWGVDIGADFNSTSTKLLSLESDTGVVEAESETNTFTLTLPQGTETIKLMPIAENKNYRFKIYKNEYTPEETNDFKRTQDIPVEDGDIIFIGVGHASWHSWMPDGVTETVYTVNISVKAEEESSKPEHEKSSTESSEPEHEESSEESKKTEPSEEENSQETSVLEKELLSAEQILEETAAQIKSTDHTVFGYEWENMTLARLGKISSEEKSKYLENLHTYLKENPLSTATDYAKYTIVLASLGIRVTEYQNEEFLEHFSAHDFASAQGLNGVVYTLIALDTVPYEESVSSNREQLISDILDAQLSDGGWTFYGDVYDPDMTGMALQALAPYYEDERVKTAVDKAVMLLSEVQNENGTYSSYGSENCESTAQVVTALSALKIDADKDERFVKNGKSVLDGLKSFYQNGKGAFSHAAGETANKYSTAQAFYALCSYDRFIKGMTRLYDMSDLFVNAAPAETTSRIEEESVTSGNPASSEVIQNSQESSRSSVVSQQQSSNSSAAGTVSAAMSQTGTVNTADNLQTASVYVVMLIAAAGIMIFMFIKNKIETEM